MIIFCDWYLFRDVISSCWLLIIYQMIIIKIVVNSWLLNIIIGWAFLNINGASCDVVTFKKWASGTTKRDPLPVASSTRQDTRHACMSAPSTRRHNNSRSDHRWWSTREVQASFVASERVLSVGGLVATNKRNRLGWDTWEIQFSYMKAWSTQCGRTSYFRVLEYYPPGRRVTCTICIFGGSSWKLPWKRARHGSVEASVNVSTKVTSTENSTEALTEASREAFAIVNYFHGHFRGRKLASTEAFDEAFVGVNSFHQSFRGSKLASTEDFTEAFTEPTPTPNPNPTPNPWSFLEAFVKLSTEALKLEKVWFHERFHGSFHGRFHGRFHGSFRGSKLRSPKPSRK